MAIYNISELPRDGDIWDFSGISDGDIVVSPAGVIDADDERTLNDIQSRQGKHLNDISNAKGLSISFFSSPDGLELHFDTIRTWTVKNALKQIIESDAPLYKTSDSPLRLGSFMTIHLSNSPKEGYFLAGSKPDLIDVVSEIVNKTAVEPFDKIEQMINEAISRDDVDPYGVLYFTMQAV